MMLLCKAPVTMLWLPLVFIFSVWCAHAKKDGAPRISKTKLVGGADDMQYFEDSQVLLAHIQGTGDLWRSSDAGESWDQVDEVNEVVVFRMHPYDNQKAYALTYGNRHYYSKDQGKSWDVFEIDDGLKPGGAIFSFHAEDSDKVIFNAQECQSIFCRGRSFYTTNGFKTIKPLRDDTQGCIYAKSTPEIKTVQDDSLVYCITGGKQNSLRREAQRLLKSSNYFETEEEALRDSGRTVPGAINMAAVKGYLVVAQKSEGTSELALYISDDGLMWDRAEFPKDHKIEEDAYTILESTNYSIQVDVMSSREGMSTLFSSNSNGTYFSENIQHVNRNSLGYIDFEKVQGIQGIYMVNVVDNWEETHHRLAEKKLRSKITFDDGRTFGNLEVVESDGKSTGEMLQLHSVTGMSNSGRVFSSPAPGLVMGVGNTGSFLKPYQEGDLYVSDDAGLTWRLAMKEAHKYEFGDQGSVLLAIYDEGITNKMEYSLDHGRTWEQFELPEEVSARILTTVPDSTSLKFVLLATVGGGSGIEHYVYSIDFKDVFERKCTDDDFENWWARVDEKGDPDCLMGHKQKYRRRKANANCYIGDLFHEAQVETVDCVCTKDDFECDYNFVKEDGECKPTKALKVADDVCKDGEDTFKGPSGYRLIPGNTCNRDGGVSPDKDEKEWPCSATKKPPPASGEISAPERTTFEEGRFFRQKVYLEREKGGSARGDDETVLTATELGDIYISHDHGKVWKKVKFGDDEKILAIYPHAYDHDVVFFLTRTKKVYYSVNRGATFDSFEAPNPPVMDSPLMALSFHQDYKDWLIWTASVDCEGFGNPNCHNVAYYSKDRGDDWETLARYCKKCEFIKREGRAGEEELVYCEKFQDERLDGNLQLLSSSDWFASEPRKHFDDILTFATMSEFIVVANKDGANLKLDASVDGKTFADAKFPKDFNVPHQTAYTLLDSSTHSVFLQVTVSASPGFEYGRIMKSNSNGTSYVLSIDAVNQNALGYVDFEKMQGIEGVALVNVVSNLDEGDSGRPKLLKTMITHNDGAQWALLEDVSDSAGGDGFLCEPGTKDCSLHIHGYTERRDPRKTFSSASAIGLMMGVGNVGPYLTGDHDADTFITRDGGIKWHRVMKGKYMWEYLDQGSVIVIVQDGGQTDIVYYSLDEGNTWSEFQFSPSKVTVEDITTVPSDNSQEFLIWGTDSSNKLITINVDLSGLRGRTCILNEDGDNGDEGDYELWTPRHPLQDDDCLFGHEALYHRKKLSSDCWNGRKVEALHSIEKHNCTCTRQDFECDYNYQIAADNTCQLVPGLNELDPVQACKDDPSLQSYFETKGYRRIPITTCSGGQESIYYGEEKPCPGHEQQFEDSRPGLRGFGLFIVAFVLPFSAAGAIGYYIWTRWDGKFGRIRLGDTSSAFDADQPWIKWPVAVVAGVVAVVAAVPLLLGAVWRQAIGLFRGRTVRYTTRDSFARGRGDYAVVDPDEDELLGDDEEDEV